MNQPLNASGREFGTSNQLAVAPRQQGLGGSFNSSGGSFNANSFDNDPISFGVGRDGNHTSFSDAGEEPYAPAPKSVIFPLELFKCCPYPVRSLFPSTWSNIQDWTHFSLVLGIIGLIVMVVQVMFQLIGDKCCHEATFKCLEEGLILASSGLCGWYIIKSIGTYDEQIQEKERLIAERKKELSASYDSLINSMDDLLGKAAESSATMAERSFESKRRDFQRFLERAETRYTQIAGTKIDTEMMLQQFRRFVQRWLVVFEECSVDPIGCPKRVVTEEELNRCRTIGDVASLTLERLKATEVRFISSQRDKDAKMLRGFRATIRSITAAPQKSEPGSAPAPQEIEMSAGVRRPPSSPSASFQFEDAERGGGRGGSDSSESRQAKQKELDKRCCPCEWCQFGAFPCSYLRLGGDQGYPRIFSCLCGQFKMLSRMHFLLMIGCLSSIGVVVNEALFVKGFMPTIVVGASLFSTCLMVLLVRFEQIDIIQRLEREVNELEGENNRIVERKEQMVHFWNSMQSLTDLWVHRTVPRLDLLKEVQGHLEDCPPEDVLALMAGANTRLEDLENHLPELSLWRHQDGSLVPELTEDSKKAFAERVERLCHEEKLPKILHGINKVIEDRLLALEGQGEQVPTAAISYGPNSFDRSSGQGGTPGLSFQNSDFGQQRQTMVGSFERKSGGGGSFRG